VCKVSKVADDGAPPAGHDEPLPLPRPHAEVNGDALLAAANAGDTRHLPSVARVTAMMRQLRTHDNQAREGAKRPLPEGPMHAQQTEKLARTAAASTLRRDTPATPAPKRDRSPRATASGRPVRRTTVESRGTTGWFARVHHGKREGAEADNGGDERQC